MFADVLLTGALALGGWGAAGCGPVGPVAAGYEWRTRSDDPGRVYLYRHGIQAAGYDRVRDVYRTYDARTDTWGPPQAPPWRIAPERAGDVRNFGVDTDKLNGHGNEQYRLNGVPATREQVRKTLADQRVPDDAGRLRLTLIGDPAATARVQGDLAGTPALAAWKDRLLVQSYPPDHWAVARTGFKTDGKPTIYVQAPDGTVLHRQDDYRDGPDALSQALRRADPHYDPRKDPDLRQRLLPNWRLPSLPAPVWILGAGVVYLLFRRR